MVDAGAFQDGEFCGQWRGWANGSQHEIGGHSLRQDPAHSEKLILADDSAPWVVMRRRTSHSVLSVLNQHSTKETPTVERRIRTSQLAPLHERITIRHELSPTRRNETQPYAIIRGMYACELEHRRLIEYALARRPEYVLRDGESASFDRELIHMS